MTVALRLTGFAAAVAVLAAGAALAGGALDPDRADTEEAHAMGTEHGHSEAAPTATPPGLAISDRGRTLRLLSRTVRRGADADLRFRITDDAGAAVTDFDLRHERRMHLILVRRDGAGFQHLHPVMSGDGTWSVRTHLPEAGSYRVFADFSGGGESLTLGADLPVDGPAGYRPLPPPAATATAGEGITVRLHAEGSDAAHPQALRFTVMRGGRPVRTQPYLGAGGHLVALREGDLAFLHTHPTDEDDDARTDVAFETTFPSAGRYRLYLQFRLAGRVHTAEFTREVTS